MLIPAIELSMPSMLKLVCFIFCFQALLQSAVQQQETAIEKQYISAIEKHSHKCEELLNAQVIKIHFYMSTCAVIDYSNICVQSRKTL